MDNIFEQMANVSKAHAYDIAVQQVIELKEVINQLIEVGELEDIKFTSEEETEKFQKLVTKAKIISLTF